MASESMNVSVGIIGVGSMGSAIARGLVTSGTLDASQLVVCDAIEACTQPLAELGMRVVAGAQELTAEQTDVVVLAVKPQVLPDVCAGLADSLEGRLVVSIAAGVALATLEELLPGARVVRVMPNLPI